VTWRRALVAAIAIGAKWRQVAGIDYSPRENAGISGIIGRSVPLRQSAVFGPAAADAERVLAARRPAVGRHGHADGQI
jgi:hypothetical protein